MDTLYIYTTDTLIQHGLDLTILVEILTQIQSIKVDKLAFLYSAIAQQNGHNIYTGSCGQSNDVYCE